MKKIILTLLSLLSLTAMQVRADEWDMRYQDQQRIFNEQVQQQRNQQQENWNAQIQQQQMQQIINNQRNPWIYNVPAIAPLYNYGYGTWKEFN